jgi:hypothetical protein
VDPAPHTRKGRAPLVVGALVLVLAAGGLSAWLKRDAPVPVAAPVAANGSVPAGEPPARPPASSAAPVFTPLSAVDAILAGASPERKVTVEVQNTRVRIGRREFNFAIRSSHRGYVYLYMVGTAGDFHLLFPNTIDRTNLILPDKVLGLPRPKWNFEAGGPPGTDHFLVMVADTPRDFSATGLMEGEFFSEFPIARAAQLQRAYAGTTPLFAGVPSCARAPCPASYGAASFNIEERTE